MDLRNLRKKSKLPWPRKSPWRPPPRPHRRRPRRGRPADPARTPAPAHRPAPSGKSSRILWSEGGMRYNLYTLISIKCSYEWKSAVIFYFFCNLKYFINFREEPYLFTKQYVGSGSARNPIIFIYPDPTIGLLSKIEMFTKITKYFFLTWLLC